MRALFLLCLLPLAANADQCQVFDRDLKPKVIDLLKPGRRFVEWCEPCHEGGPSAARQIEKIDLAPFDEGSLELTVNGEGADLAYLFVETMPGTGRFVNAAKAVSCPAQDVSAEVNPRPSNAFDGTWAISLSLVGRGCDERPVFDSLTVMGDARPVVSSAEGRWSAEKTSDAELVLVQPVASGVKRTLKLRRDGDALSGVLEDVRGERCHQRFTVAGSLR
jgi:hypothetical protein